jgi:hypothetical protein
MPTLSSNRHRWPWAIGLAAVLASLATAHGIFQKPFWNNKANFATRGAAGSASTTLYMMQPPLYLTGEHQSIGWQTRMQDEEAATQETCTFSYVKYAANGTDPDLSPTGMIFKSTYRLFGFGEKGTKAFDFTLTVGFPQQLPRNFGIAIDVPANSQWPSDGASMHAQLNVPQDSRRSRVPPPYDQQVWAFERPQNAQQATALGGRVLDVLQVWGLYIEPTMQIYLRTKAYGLGTEDLLGPEAMHPVAARGDEIGLEINGGQIGTDGWGIVYLSPSLGKVPIPLPRGFFYLDIAGGFPVTLLLAQLDSLGGTRTATLPVSAVPPGFRSFWLQTLIVNPYTLELEITDAVGMKGL